MGMPPRAPGVPRLPPPMPRASGAASAAPAGRCSRTERLALLLLCPAFLQGGFSKLLDFGGAVAEVQYFGLPVAALTAVLTTITELLGSALVLSGRPRWLGARWLAGLTLAANPLANRSWGMPPGHGRFMAANGFFEHLRLVGGFLLLAWRDRPRPPSPLA